MLQFTDIRICACAHMHAYGRARMLKLARRVLLQFDFALFVDCNEQRADSPAVGVGVCNNGVNERASERDVDSEYAKVQ